MSERPWFKFYPGDWRSESALRMVSMGARALWLEMLCIMHESEPRGYMVVRDKPLPMRQLALIAACSLDDVNVLLVELEEAGVFSRTRTGVIFSRKMVRESRVSEEQRQKAETRWEAVRAEKAGEIKSGNADGNAEHHAGSMPISKIPEPEPNPERISDADASSVVSAKPKPTSRPLDEIKTAFEAWNALADRKRLPKARSLDQARRKAIRSRLADGGLDAWRQALAAVERSPLCRGENDRNWRADLDFVCQPKSWRRLLEGFYGGAVPLALAQAGAESWSEDRWTAAVQIFAERGMWSETCGPAPDQPGCRAPPNVLTAHGFGGEGTVVPFEPRTDRSAA